MLCSEKKTKTILCTLLAGLTLLAAGCGGGATPSNGGDTKKAPSSLEQIKQKGEITVAIETNYPPYDFVDTSKQGKVMTGIDVALSKKIGEKLGVKVKMVDSNFTALLASVSSNKVDLGMSGMTATEERAKTMDFSDPYINSKYVVIIRKSDADKFTTLESFDASTKMGVEKSSTAIPVVTADMPNTKQVVLDQIPDLLMELKQNKLDGFAVDEVIAQQYLITNPDVMVASVQFKSPKAKMDTIVSAGKDRDNAELMNVVNEVIKEARDSGEVQQWIKEYSELAVNNAKS
ncbi:transporter substrate-binding domain-containing protein [Megasphaera sueciensis]|uniref:transporter substrate-binding domain-containing protein n=1 Tax=Megasphaera sueciensis TaxID=349094 RepID=UPI003CFC6FD4